MFFKVNQLNQETFLRGPALHAISQSHFVPLS